MKRLLLMVMLIGAADVYAKCGVPTTHRSSKTREQFERMTGYPHGRKGWVADHIIPLCKGGPDTVENLQWQTKEEAKKKVQD